MTVCDSANQACPFFPSARRYHVSLPDPSGQGLGRWRESRDQVGDLVYPLAERWLRAKGCNQKVGEKAFESVFANSFVMAKLKIYSEGRHLWMRTIGSSLVGELIDTGLFCVMAFAAILPWGQLVNYPITGGLYKVAVEVVMTPVTYWIVAFLKREEEQDVYDRDTNFNPFHMD